MSLHAAHRDKNHLSLPSTKCYVKHFTDAGTMSVALSDVDKAIRVSRWKIFLDEETFSTSKLLACKKLLYCFLQQNCVEQRERFFLFCHVSRDGEQRARNFAKNHNRGKLCINDANARRLCFHLRLLHWMTEIDTVPMQQTEWNNVLFRFHGVDAMVNWADCQPSRPHARAAVVLKFHAF